MKFSFSIANASGGDKKMCLLPGTLPTLGVSVANAYTLDASSDDITAVASTATVHYHNIENLTNYGIDVDGVIDDGTPVSGVTVTPKLSRFKVRHFLQYLQKFPQVVTGLTIKVSNKDVFNEIISIRQDTPLKGTDENYIILQDYFGLLQVQDNKINITPNTPWPATADAIWSMNIPDGRTVEFTFTLAPFKG